MRKLLFCLWSIVALFGPLNAQTKEPVLRVKVQYDTVGLKETFRIEYIFENTQSVNFSTPVFEGFQLLQGPYQSSQFSSINGVSSSSVSFSYVLQANALGPKVIAAQKVYINNSSYNTPEAVIVVVEEINRQNFSRSSSPFDMPSFGFDNGMMEKMQRQQEEMMKRHKDLLENPDSFFNNPNDFFNFPRQFGPDINEMFKNFDNLFQFKMPPVQKPQKPADRTYKL